MPIEGSWNTVKAFFLTETILSKPDNLNSFANESLWYVQYFFGRETMKQQGKKFYLVQKPKTESSWTASSIKTTAYFFSALIWIIPGIIARLLSFDSKKVTSTVFADRITEPSPKNRKASRPTAPKPTFQPIYLAEQADQGCLDSIDAVFANRIASPPPLVTQEVPRPALPPPALPSQMINPAKLDDQPAVLTADKPTATPASELEMEPAIVDPVFLAARAENHAQILNEVKQAIAFFADLNQRTNNPKKLKKWLKTEQAKPIYLQPFYFSRHLKWALERKQGKIERIIPPETLSRLKEEFDGSSKKLKTLGLEAYLNDEVEGKENNLPQTPKNIDDDLQKGINSYKELFTLKGNHAEWLEKNQIVCLLFMTLYWHSIQEMGMSLDADKLKLLGGFYSKCKQLLNNLKLDAYLKEKPKTISPGLYSLVHCLTEHLTQHPPQLAPATAKILTATPAQPLRAVPLSELTVSSAELKLFLMQTTPDIECLPGITAVFENARLFQQNKAKLLQLLKQYWINQSIFFQTFLSLPSNLPLLQGYIEATRESEILYLAPFSNQRLALIETLKPILGDNLYNTWKQLYNASCLRLRQMKLTCYIEEKLPNKFDQIKAIEKKQIEDFLRRAIPFFNKFIAAPKEQAQNLLNEQMKDPLFPFFYSFDLQCNMENLQHLLNENLLSEWKELYPQACNKLKELGFSQYWDEIPPGFIEELLKFANPAMYSDPRNCIALFCV